MNRRLLIMSMVVLFLAGGCTASPKGNASVSRIVEGLDAFGEVLGGFREEHARWPEDSGELVWFARERGHEWHMPEDVSFTVRDDILVMTMQHPRRRARPEDSIALRWENGGVTLVPVPR